MVRLRAFEEGYPAGTILKVAEYDMKNSLYARLWDPGGTSSYKLYKFSNIDVIKAAVPATGASSAVWVFPEF